MLTGDLMPSSGNAFRGNFDLFSDLSAYRSELGYCPQFDPLLDKLTGRETLFLFGRLRGIPSRDLPHVVDQLIEMSDLKAHAHKRTETYSGGNKRKLSLAIALTANPKVILLDEPTAGVDPSARRKIWSSLSHVRSVRGCCIILTSHSMQECENLCSRISIMVGGRLRCMGSAQQLRARYGQGFTISMKLKRNNQQDPEYEKRIAHAISSLFPSAVVTDRHETLLTYRVPDPRLLWSKLFEGMEQLARQFNLEDYTVSDTTLEQIFIGFARNSVRRLSSSPSLAAATPLLPPPSAASDQPPSYQSLQSGAVNV